jgi:chaperonin GroEL
MTRSARSTRRRTSVRRPAVIFQPSSLLAGIHLMANAVKPTLGPLPRFVGIESSIRDRPPELLDNAAVIARRIIQVAHPTADVGAMMMRHALWRMHEVCGDGAATMAVIAQAILKQADKAIAAGRHPTLIRHGIEQGVKQATAQLSAAIIRPAGGRQARDLLMALARTSCSDSDLRDILVEVVSIIGANGAVQVVNHNGRGVEREYIEGALWDSPWLTTGFATEYDQSVARLTDGAVVLLDGKLDAAEDVLQGMRRLYELGYRSALIVAGDLSDEVKALLIQAKLNDIMYVLPVKAPGIDARRAAALQDLAVLTGARVLFGDSAAFARLTAEDVGSVRRAWANARQFGIIGGRRDPFALRAAIASVRKRIEETTDLDEISELRLRLGRLSGGIAILRVGGVTSRDQEQRREQAVRLTRLLQMASAGGYLAGGGAALFKVGEALCAASAAHKDDDVAVGFRCLAQALAAPLMTIAANAGFDARAVADRVRAASRASPDGNFGLDVRRGEVTDLIAAGIMDAAEVLIRAVQIAGSLAATAITTTAVVHHRKLEMATKP